MLYRLFEYLNENTDLPGMRIGEYISFRSAAAIILSLLIAIVFGKRIIRFLKSKQIGEDIRDLGLEGILIFIYIDRLIGFFIFAGKNYINHS